MAISKIDPNGLDLTGDAAFDTDTLVVDSTNNRVGIGTDTPTKKLEIVGTTNNADSGVIRTTNANDTGSSVQTGLYVTNGLENGQFSMAGQGYGGYGAYVAGNALVYSTQAVTIMADSSPDGDIKFASGGNTERMRIDSSGDVGIGTSTPSALLDVGGGDGTPFSTQFAAVINAEGSSTRTLYLDGSSSGTSMWWGTGNTPTFAIDSQNSAGGVLFWTHDSGTWSQRMGIDTNGRIRKYAQPIISGQIGTAQTDPLSGQVLKFNEFWVNQGGISYNATNGRFTVPVAGIYRITINPFFHTDNSGGRVVIGINDSSPSTSSHYGHAYREEATYDTVCLNSVVSLSANDYIVFYLYAGKIYNQSVDRFNQFTIELIA